MGAVGISKQAMILIVNPEQSLSPFYHSGRFFFNFIFNSIIINLLYQSLKSFHVSQIWQHMAAVIVGIICVIFFGHSQFGSVAPTEML